MLFIKDIKSNNLSQIKIYLGIANTSNTAFVKVKIPGADFRGCVLVFVQES